MSKINKLVKYFSNKDFRFLINSGLNLFGADRVSDEEAVKRMYRYSFGRELDLENPCTYSEKLQWLKLYDRRPEYTALVDKYEVKKIVADMIGEEYIIPTLGVWDSFEQIDFDSLPQQFVLKCTHDSGGLVVCKNKDDLNYNKVKKKLEKCLAHDYFVSHREWPYKNVKRRIIAEVYMEDEQTSELRDYKFFCFDGEVKAMFIATDRGRDTETKFDFFDEKFNHLPFINGHPNAENCPQKPQCFELMKRLAATLSNGIPEVRVDLYEVNGKVYFGEMTFFHWSGLMPFEPEKWDYTFGSWIKLPRKSDE